MWVIGVSRFADILKNAFAQTRKVSGYVHNLRGLECVSRVACNNPKELIKDIPFAFIFKYNESNMTDYPKKKNGIYKCV